MRQIELLRFTVAALDRLEIPYAIVGSMASSAWGEPRMTRDIDIVIRLSADQVADLCNVSQFAAKLGVLDVWQRVLDREQ